MAVYLLQMGTAGNNIADLGDRHCQTLWLALNKIFLKGSGCRSLFLFAFFLKKE